MRNACLLYFLLIFTFLHGCSSVWVKQDYDESVDFLQFTTFDWAEPEQPETGDVEIDNPLMDRRIRNAIEQNLTSRGIVKASGPDPDLLVAYRLMVKTRIEADPIRTGVGYGGYRGYYGIHGYHGWGGIGFETRIREYEEGILVIDIGDADVNNLIWRGTGSRRVTEQSDPQETTRIVNQTVEEILKQFPPKKK